MPASEWDCTVEPAPLARPFRVSHTEVASITTVHARLGSGGYLGHGVVAVGPWREEDPQDVTRTAAALVDQVFADEPTVQRLESVLAPHHRRAPSATYLVEMCVLDLLCSRATMPLWRLLGIARPARRIEVFHTLSLGETVPNGGQARLKVKVGGPDDEAVLDALIASGCPTLLDANRGWTSDDLVRLADRLAQVHLLAVEDPVQEWRDLDRLRTLLPGTPLIADEGVTSAETVVAALRFADGVNLKLVKMGGLLPTVRAARDAARQGKRVMLGCFIEPVRSIGYAATASALVDWCDLDGHTFLDAGWSSTELSTDSDGIGPTVLRPVGH